jgi:hypothetical protein
MNSLIPWNKKRSETSTPTPYTDCCIMNSPIWVLRTHFTLTNFVRHSKDPEYMLFLNIIWKRRPIEKEIQQYLRECFVSESDVLSSLDDATTILFTHRKHVDMYNNLRVSKIFHESAIHSFNIWSNASTIDEYPYPSIIHSFMF